MKKLLLIFLLPLTFFAYTEEKDGDLIYLNCINEDEFLRDANQNETIVIDKKKKLFFSKTAFEWKLTENDTYYFASSKNEFALQEYTLNRISLELNYKNTQIENGKIQPNKWSYNDYKCQKVNRI
tara:strand:+ start:254 stop:628 length:375 start_codon:yes stop_codon:yes gene_type:complete